MQQKQKTKKRRYKIKKNTFMCDFIHFKDASINIIYETLHMCIFV